MPSESPTSASDIGTLEASIRTPAGSGISSNSSKQNQARDTVVFAYNKNEERFECSDCNSKHPTLKLLKSHKRSSHTPYTCLSCGVHFQGYSRLAMHRKSQHPQSLAFRCTKNCTAATGQTFPTYYLLRRHWILEHCEFFDTVNRKRYSSTWKCLICQEILPSELHLIHHRCEQHSYPAQDVPEIDAPTDLPNDPIGRMILQKALNLLCISDAISVDEMLDLWSSILPEGERRLIVHRLSDALASEDSRILSRLEDTAFSVALEAYNNVKDVYFHLPHQYHVIHNSFCPSSLQIGWAVITYCKDLEAILEPAAAASNTQIGEGTPLRRLPGHIKTAPPAGSMAGCFDEFHARAAILGTRPSVQKGQYTFTSVADAYYTKDYVSALRETMRVVFLPKLQTTDAWCTLMGMGRCVLDWRVEDSDGDETLLGDEMPLGDELALIVD